MAPWEVGIEELKTSLDPFFNINALREFIQKAKEYLPAMGKRYLDVGHGKRFEFPVGLARELSDASVMNYDSRKWTTKAFSLWQRGQRRKRVYLPENLSVSKFSKPRPFFDGVFYIFTLHEFLRKEDDEGPRETLKEVKKLLRPGRNIYIVDYDLEGASEKIVRAVFNAKNEIGIVTPGSGSFEKDWYGAHTGYSKARCIDDLEGLGYEIVYEESQPKGIGFRRGELEWSEKMSKLFFVIARAA
ncbi:hypothetical protein CMI37_10550 [Candidatus Pacearchaeota archaeon]|nr:hypothetical protein [Candidatus Pacearchaeota archaeon]